MNDLRSPLEDRPYNTRTTRQEDTAMTTAGYYRAKLEAMRQSRWFPLASVLAAVLVFSGVVSYAYQQGSQTGVNATTPIVQASAEDYKTKPENSGGMDVPFQDAIVFDQFQDSKQKTTSIESLLPPPEQPVAATTDAPTTTATAQQTAAATTAAPQTLDDVVDQVVIQEKTAAATETVTTQATAQAETTAKAATQAPTQAATQTNATLAKTMDNVAPASAPATTRIESGSYRIQLGSFRDEASARKAWDQYKKQFSSQLSSITPDFPRADLGAKGIFYRAQGTNLSKASAEELCRSINAAKSGSCLVTR